MIVGSSRNIYSVDWITLKKCTLELVISQEKFSIVDNDNIICNVDFEAIGESIGQSCCSWNIFATNRALV